MIKTGAIFSFILIVILFSCKSYEKEYTRILATDEFDLPPATIKIGPNLYIDCQEVSNFSYLEFLYWTSKVYPGKYSSMLPDSASWAEDDTLGSTYIEYYMRHPAYRDYPVVGVSYEQALEFCKWRSDRVMEFILIKKKVLPPLNYKGKTKPFTIEDYFSGNYMGIKPDPLWKWYPEYSLPDTNVFKNALKFSDEFNSTYNYKKRGRYNCDVFYNTINCAEFKKKRDTLDKLIAVASLCAKDIIVHLRGNARELTNVRGVSFGGSYMDSCKVAELAPIQHYDSTDTHTGFRNMCRWKRWPGL